MVKTLAELRKKCPKCAKISTILTRSNNCAKVNTISSNSSWDMGQIGNKLRAKHVTYQKLANNLQKNVC